MTVGADETRVVDARVAWPGVSRVSRTWQSLGGLGRKAMSGAAWTFGNHFLGQGMRLAGNLVLTRLLFPEAFGVMALVQLLMQGLAMFSDIGLGPAVVQSKRGDDPAFLDTVFTVQAIRGVGLWFIACVCAWPMAWLYETPELTWVIPVAGFTAVIQGLRSPAMLTAQRKIKLGKLTVLDLSGGAIGVGVMIAWAWWSPTIWALVAGGWATALYRTIMTHAWLSDRLSRFRIEREAATWIYRFVRWITASTAFTFLALQADRLILPALFNRAGGEAIEGEGVAYLAFYQLAFVLATMPTEIVGKVCTSVMFPAYAELSRRDTSRIRPAMHRFRRLVVPPMWVLMAVLMLVAQPLIELMYDPRYQQAGPMLELLAIAGMFTLLRATYNGCFIPLGKVSWILWMTIVDSVLRIGLPVIGFFAAGPDGFVGGVVGATAAGYLVMAAAMGRLGVWQRWLDAPFVLLSLAAFAFAAYSGPATVWSVWS
ncbi:MAG: oligosaccharide flippase family protein [Planctomycetota bacterium]